MVKVIAVFDIGKTNKKILLFDNKFNVVYQNEEKFPVITDEDGFECDDIELITGWIKTSLEKIISEGEYDLTAVNFSTYGASLMFLDAQGNRLTPVYNYLKEIPGSIQDELFDKYGGQEEFCRRTASPALGMLLNSGIQVRWLKKERPGTYNKSQSVLHFPQYLAYTLSGKIVSEPTSIGCHTFMWDFDNKAYHPWLEDMGIQLPEPINNDITFPATIAGKDIRVGIGIHDSSASLVPYLKQSTQKFILISTGTWCINMNPFNDEPLTSEQLASDCLCYLTPGNKQVKSSRLFMGHFHDTWVEKISAYFSVSGDFYKSVAKDEDLIADLVNKYGKESVFFSKGKEGFEEGLDLADPGIFADPAGAYTKLMIDLTSLCIDAIQLVIPENDETDIFYVSGGFARNEIFIYLLGKNFPDKKVEISEIDNSSALGAALIISDTFQA